MHCRPRYKVLMADALPLLSITSADIDAAARVLAPFAVRTPLLSSPALDERVGATVFLKPEMLQRTGSFKFRGAFNKLSSIPQDARGGGVVAFSSGNHAQGVAAAAQILNMRATIVMPADAPRSKRERTKGYCAEVVLYDRDREDREAIADDIARKHGATLVRPYDDPKVIAGQGTVGREIAEDLAALGVTPDIVVAPASGGGRHALGMVAGRERDHAASPLGLRDGRHLVEGAAKLERSGPLQQFRLEEDPGSRAFVERRRR